MTTKTIPTPPNLETLSIEIDGEIGTLTLDRPEALNAINNTLAREREEALKAAGADDEVKAILIRGRGRAFCAGRDLKELSSEALGNQAESWRIVRSSGLLALSNDWLIPKPTIAVVHGFAVAGGFEMMMWCDLAIVTDDAQIGDYHLNRGLLGGAGLAAVGTLLGGATAFGAGFGAADRAILNFALTLEYLEDAFYTRALEHAGLSGELRRFCTVVAAHERSHVEALSKLLGSRAARRPRFDFGGATRSPRAFVSTSILLEDTGVEAYQGATRHIRSDRLLSAALSIHPVEARHASWIRYIAGHSPAPAPVNPAAEKSQVLATVRATGFVKG